MLVRHFVRLGPGNESSSDSESSVGGYGGVGVVPNLTAQAHGISSRVGVARLEYGLPRAYPTRFARTNRPWLI